MSRRISELDVPVATLREQIAALVARQRETQADRSAERLQAFLAPTQPAPFVEESR